MVFLTDKLDKCIHAGIEGKWLTEHKPNCRECDGYKVECENNGNYFPYKRMIRKNE